MEETAYQEKGLPCEKYMQLLLMLVVDGASDEQVEQIGVAGYFSSGATDYEALIRILILYGVLSIQDGENPYVVENKLLTFVPEDISKQYLEMRDDVKPIVSMSHHVGEDDKTTIEKYFEGDLAVNPGDADYYLIKVADYALSKAYQSDVTVMEKRIGRASEDKRLI